MSDKINSTIISVLDIGTTKIIALIAEYDLEKNKIIKIIGFGESSKETLSSVISMRNQLLSEFFLKSEDVVFLRGAQEEMFL